VRAVALLYEIGVPMISQIGVEFNTQFGRILHPPVTHSGFVEIPNVLSGYLEKKVGELLIVGAGSSAYLPIG
jgi:hypothetical protein